MEGLSGIFSGIDTMTLVEGTLATNSTRLTLMSNQAAQLSAEDRALAEFESRLSSLDILVTKIGDSSELKKVSASSTDSSVAYAAVNGSRGEGTYLIEVAQLASSEKKVHEGLATTETLVGEGVFEYQYDGQTISIDTTATTTLTELQDLINNDMGNPGVTASILQYDDGAGGVYHLILTGDKSGSDYGITISGGTTLAAFQDTGSEWTTTSAAQDSKIRIDGYPSNDWIERSSNSISDVIPGVTLNLVSAGSEGTPESTTITLNRDTSELIQDLTDMAVMLTGLKASLDSYTGYDEENETSGVLQGDYFLHGIFKQLTSVLTQTVSGFENGVDTHTLASHIGLELVDKKGTWAFDTSTFNDAVEADYEGVLDLIGMIASGSTDSTDIEFTNATGATQAGTYDIQIDYDGVGAITAARIKLETESEYRDMTVTGSVLSAGSIDDPERYLEITIAQTGNNETLSYQVRVKRGFATAIRDSLDDMLDAYDGMFTLKRNSYSNTEKTGSLDRLEKRMKTEQERLQKMETWLIQKYARLETELSRLDSQRGAFDALFASVITNDKKD